VSSQPLPAKLSPDLWEALHGIKSVRVYPRAPNCFSRVTRSAEYMSSSRAWFGFFYPRPKADCNCWKWPVRGQFLGLSESMSGERHRSPPKRETIHQWLSFRGTALLLREMHTCMQKSPWSEGNLQAVPRNESH